MDVSIQNRRVSITDRETSQQWYGIQKEHVKIWLLITY